MPAHWISQKMEVVSDEIEILQHLKSKKEIPNEVPLYFRVRAKKGGIITFMKYQALKINYPQILIKFFQKRLVISGNNLSIRDVLPEDTQIRLNSMIQSYEDTIDGLNLLQNEQLKNHDSFDNRGNKRKKEGQGEESVSATRKFRKQKEIIYQQEGEKGNEANSSKKRDKNERVTPKQKKKKVNYDEILMKKVGQNYKVFYFPAYLSLFISQKLQKKDKKQSKQKVQKRVIPLLKKNKAFTKKKQTKKPTIVPNLDSVDITFTDSEDEHSKSKNKKKFR